VVREEFVRELLVLLELCHVMPPDTPHRDPIATSHRKPPSRPSVALNDLGTAVALGFTALLLAVSLVTAIWPPPRRLTLKADWVLCELAAQSQEELRQDIVIAVRADGRRSAEEISGPSIGGTNCGLERQHVIWQC
jgi:hypothetical protein